MSFLTILHICKTCFSKQHGVNSCWAVSRASKILSSEVTFSQTSQSSSFHKSSIIFISGDWGVHTMIVSIPEICLYSKYLLHNLDVCSTSLSCCIMNPHIINISPKGTAWLIRMEWYPTLSSVPLMLNNVPTPLSQNTHIPSQNYHHSCSLYYAVRMHFLFGYMYDVSDQKNFKFWFFCPKHLFHCSIHNFSVAMPIWGVSVYLYDVVGISWLLHFSIDLLTSIFIGMYWRRLNVHGCCWNQIVYLVLFASYCTCSSRLWIDLHLLLGVFHCILILVISCFFQIFDGITNCGMLIQSLSLIWGN